MGRRLNLQSELVAILGSDNVYFQPPESVKLNYPCIVYRRGSGDTKFSGNMPYLFRQAYEITIIDEDPDSGLILALAVGFPMIRFNRHYVKDNLNHDVFTLYY